MTRLSLFLLAACSSLEPSGTPFEGPAVTQGLQIALDCGKRNFLKVQHPPETLRFYLSSGFADIRGSMRADSVAGREVWVDYRMAGEVLVIAHASLHAIFGLPGGVAPHPPIFKECGL